MMCAALFGLIFAFLSSFHPRSRPIVLLPCVILRWPISLDASNIRRTHGHSAQVEFGTVLIYTW